MTESGDTSGTVHADPASPRRRMWDARYGTWWALGPIVLVVALAALVPTTVAHPGRFWTNQDFHVYHAFGQAVRDGLSVYGPVPGTSMPFTYPPFAAHVLSVFSYLALPAAEVAMLAVSLSCLVGICSMVLAWAGARAQVRWGLATAVAGAALWVEPVQCNLLLGQINLVICALVVHDLTRPRGSRWVGVGVGLAAGLKLTSGLFLVHFLVTRQFRAFWTGVATFAATVAVGAVLAPRDSLTFWTGGFAGTGRISEVTPLSFAANQSLNGFAVRILGQDGGPRVTVLWLLLAVPVLVAGLHVARLAHRRGDDLLALACLGVTSVLVSPVSWSHHWVWVLVAGIALVRSLAVSSLASSRRALLVAGASASVALLVFFTWPGDRQGIPQPTGLIWLQPWDPFPWGARPEFDWTPLQVVAGNAYVWVGLLVLVAAHVLVRAGARAPGADDPGGDGNRCPSRTTPTGDRRRW
ncbi:glycosyltransferase 87 family protein [Geodermatophilus sp. SYSU D01036]